MKQKEMYAAAMKASSEGNKAEAVALLTNLIDTYPDTKEAEDAMALRYNMQHGSVNQVHSGSSEGIKCQQCGGKMSKTTKADSSLALQLLGVLLFLFGIGLLFVFPIGTLFGIILMLGSLRLGYSKKKIWKCSNCGYFFERA
jgi:hypothetical protein